jgi:hypothetical protein
MCIRCVRAARNLGHTRPSGREKVYAHRLLNGEGIPVFWDRAINVAIEAHVYRIQRAQTRRRYSRKGNSLPEDWCDFNYY